MNNLKLLIVDDEENMRHMLKALVGRHGYDVATARDGECALDMISQEHFDFILCDVKMPGVDGMMFLEKGGDFLKESTVIMMSAYGTVDLALQAMQAGAYDFISKPFKSDEVLLTLKKAEEREQLKKENQLLKNKIDEFSREKSFSGMIGSSDKMCHLTELATKVARYDTTVLITGESGTGKELIARGIHTGSPRKEMSFVAINCGSLPENLLESELFGHIRGAFTGADYQNKGLFREADGSTIFLDEIGELPLPMQVKLLRVLQEQEIRPVGSARSQKVNVRVLAATSRDLGSLVKQGMFREDLYYRLNVVQLRLPPLRERKEDIPLLCHHFIKKFNKKFQMRVTEVSKQAMGRLLNHEWPGNIRELENVIQRGLVLTSGEKIGVEHLPTALKGVSKKDSGDTWLGMAMESLSLKTAQKLLEEKFIRLALSEAGGNKSQAARTLEISYPSLLSKIREFAIEIDKS